MASQCPFLTPEFELIKEKHPTLASTGCTRDFCQSGKVIHTDEPRVGENRSLSIVEHDAEIFLRELYEEDFFPSEKVFHERLEHVLYEIRTSAVEGVIRETKQRGMIGGNWTQTPQELEFGLRRAWRNARKCIMRSHCEDLRLCDLRSVTSSAKMAMELIKGVDEAFNDGNIIPTAFVFPPRTPNNRGPMIWNDQILTFAGYVQEDGSILGDPKNVQLTKDIIEIGWKPPVKRTRWDVLPLVTMAEGDLPVIAELPAHLRALVDIRHPKYNRAFEKLDLKWVAFPALSRLGYDIGGVQYTATPFVGWFMDAEIGVRNLADSFRYNVLPDIAKILHLDDGALLDVDSFEDLPEYEQLAMLSRAQVELNYAVHYSFTRARVTMSDALTASMKFTRYDDEFQKKNGYRLPSDPFWLAPPQGSIVPIWHRGGSPNYQPKPMICRHVQDPAKAWKREKASWPQATPKQLSMAEVLSISSRPSSIRTSSEATLSPRTDDLELATPKKPGYQHTPPSVAAVTERLNEQTIQSLAIYYCSAGTVAQKLAAKLHDKVNTLTKASLNISVSPDVNPLDELEASEMTAEKVFLFIVSSTGAGDIPPNGIDFSDMCSRTQTLDSTKRFKYAVFGNGDSRYVSTYNAAAIKIDNQLTKMGGVSLTGGPFLGDTARQSPPWSALNTWWDQVRPKICDLAAKTTSPTFEIVPDVMEEGEEEEEEEETFELNDAPTGPAARYLRYAQDLRENYFDGQLITTTPRVRDVQQGSLRVTLDVGTATYEELSCIQILPINSPLKVDRAIKALGIEPESPIPLNTSDLKDNPTYSSFLRDFADLELPFTELRWLETIKSTSDMTFPKEKLSKLSVIDALEFLSNEGVFRHPCRDANLVYDMCIDMPLLLPRTYSVASSLRFLSEHRPRKAAGNEVDIICKVYQRGRFSGVFLKDFESRSTASLKFRFVDSIAAGRLREKQHLVPLVTMTTGAGFGPVRALLQQRIAIARDNVAAGRPLPSRGSGISLFLGLQQSDIALVTDVLVEASSLNLIDMFFMVPSNDAKVRVYDKMKMEGVAEKLKEKLMNESGMVFVCTGRIAAKETANTLEGVIGGRVKKVLAERYVEEVF